MTKKDAIEYLEYVAAEYLRCYNESKCEYFGGFADGLKKAAKLMKRTKDSLPATSGYSSTAIVEGKESVAVVTGKDSKAKGALGCWLVLTERGEWNGETYPIVEVRAVKVDGVAILPDTFYTLKGGEVVACE